MSDMKSFPHSLTHQFLLIASVLVFCGATNVSDIETAIIEKDFKKSRELAESFIKKNSNSGELNQIRYYLGVSELGLMHYEEARNIFKGIMASRPTETLYDRAWLGVIDSYGLEERFEDALTQAQKFLKERPRSEFLSVIYLKLGRANLKLSHWEVAQQYLQRLIKEFPNSFEAHTAKQLLEEKRYFSIQVGSFLEQQRAASLVEELNSKGEYAYMVETTDKEGHPFYRVRVGQFTELKEAHQMREHLSQQGYPTHIFP